MTKFINKFKKPCFWHIFGPFSQFWGQKKIFPENPALSCTTSYRFLAPCQNLKKQLIQFQENAQPDRRKDGRTDRRMDRPNFIGPFRLPPGIEKRQKHS